MKSQLIFPFACSCGHSCLLSFFHPPSWKGGCSDICPYSEARVFHHVWKSPSDQKCELLFWACISTRALQTVGEVTHRADCRQARGRVWQTGKNPNWDAYSECAVWKKAPKTQIISAYPTCLYRKMLILNKIYFVISKRTHAYMTCIKIWMLSYLVVVVEY